MTDETNEEKPKKSKVQIDKNPQSDHPSLSVHDKNVHQEQGHNIHSEADEESEPNVHLTNVDPKHHQSNRKLIGGLILILIAILVIYAYYQYEIYYPNTDDAYVGAPLINVASKVSGTVQKVYVKNNQYVKKGELMIEIDPQDYSTLVKQANIGYLVSQQETINAQRQMTNAQADIAKAESNLNFTNQMARRYTNLYHAKAGSQQTMQKYVNDRDQAKQVLDQAKTVLKQAEIQYEVAQSKTDLSRVQLENAKNTESNTILRSPVDGYVSNLTLQPGQLIGTGEKLFGLVDDSNWWIDANFKETQLERIRVSQPVSIILDLYPHTYKGVVRSISAASGSTFSLLPAQNASGNWVKVTQRFTVRIALKNDPKFPLRVGASSTVTVRTTH